MYDEQSHICNAKLKIYLGYLAIPVLFFNRDILINRKSHHAESMMTLSIYKPVTRYSVRFTSFCSNASIWSPIWISLYPFRLIPHS